MNLLYSDGSVRAVADSLDFPVLKSAATRDALHSKTATEFILVRPPREALMSWWVYKCNAKDHEYQHTFGDWRDFFSGDQSKETWDSTRWVPALAKLTRGDIVIAYQTDRNELVGLAKVRRGCDPGTYLYLDPVETIGVKVRPLKMADPKIAAIRALQPGPIKTVYAISEPDARQLLKAAGATTNIRHQASSRRSVQISVEQVFLEGERRAAMSTTRNPQLRAAAKLKWGLACYCCGFDFEKCYGPIAEGCAIVHHLRLFNGVNGKRRVATVDDVLVVCANCRYVIRLPNPPMDIDKLKEMISQLRGVRQK